MTTVATLPTYAMPNAEAQVIFTRTESGSNYCRVWVTAAPDGSELDGKLEKSTQSRFLVYQGDGGATQPWRFTADKGGVYTFKAQEYMRGSGYGGGYQGDPAGAPSETKVGAEATLALAIGKKATQKVGVSPDTATLVVWVWDTTIRATLLGVHGEASPRLEAQSPTARTLSAMATPAVLTAVAALADTTQATALGSLALIVSEMGTDINAHNALGATAHNAADADNAIPVELRSSPSPQTLAEFVNDALLKMRRHRLNDHGGKPAIPENPGTGSAAYHQIGGVRQADLLNMPLYQGVASLDEAYGALADIWRAHEGHRVSTAVHGTADTTTGLAALPKVLEVHRQYLTVLASLSPAVPPAQAALVQALVSTAGFEEA